MDVETIWWWSSHLPVLQAAVEVFRPSFILELGAGQFSTPIFAATGACVWSIDNDREWLEQVRDEFGYWPNLEFRFHDLGPDVLIGTKPHELSTEQRAEIAAFYERLASTLPEADRRFAFVDQFTSARTLSINALLGACDVIMFHDCEPAGVECYDYRFDAAKCGEYDRYTFKTPVVWTGLFVRKNLPFDGSELDRLCKLHAEQFAKQHEIDPAALFLQRDH